MISRPIITNQYSTTKNENNTLVIIYIDNSFSNISSISNDLNQIINNISSSYNKNTYIKIIRMSDNKTIYNKINDSPILISERIPIAYYPLSLDNAIKSTNDINNDFYTRKDLYVISDLSPRIFDNIQNQSVKKIDNFNMFFIKTSNNSNNIKITSIAFDKPFLLPNELFTLSCDISNNYKDIKELLIELFIDDINVGKNILNINNNKKETISFKSSLPDFGNYPCYVKISSNDNIYEDNYFYFNLNIENKSNVAIVSSNDDDTFFITGALNTFNEFYNDQKLFNYTLDSYLINNEKKFNSIILFGYNNLNQSLINKAQSQTSNIILFPTEKDFKNEYLGTLLRNPFLYQSTYKVLENDNFVSLDTERIADVYKNIFKNIDNKKTIKIFKYLELPISAETKIKQSNGTTFLYDYKYNNLTLSIFSSPLNLSSSNLPIKGSFLPFIKSLIDKSSLNTYYFANDDILYKNYQELSHTLPNNKNYPLIDETLNFNDIGIHKITDGKKIVDYISINIHPEEHNRAQLTNDEIKTYFQNSYVVENSSNLQDFLNNMLIGIEIWMYLLYIIILLTIIEMYLSNFYYKE